MHASIITTLAVFLCCRAYFNKYSLVATIVAIHCLHAVYSKTRYACNRNWRFTKQYVM